MCPFWGFRKPAEFKCILGAINDSNVRGDRQCSGEELSNDHLWKTTTTTFHIICKTVIFVSMLKVNTSLKQKFHQR